MLDLLQLQAEGFAGGEQRLQLRHSFLRLLLAHAQAGQVVARLVKVARGVREAEQHGCLAVTPENAGVLCRF